MKLKSQLKNKQFVFCIFAFIVLFSSYTRNAFYVSDPEFFLGFERVPEALVIGRLIKAEKDGVLSEGGFPGMTYNLDSTFTDSNEALLSYRDMQHNIYLTNLPHPHLFKAYTSQTGGQGILYASIQNVFKLPHNVNLQVFRGINAFLTALCFILFLGWCCRNFGLFSGIITFILLLISPWINNFSHNLWWSLWSFYLPFLVTLLCLEYKHKHPERISNIKIFFVIAAAVFIKCFFNGFEFITTTLLAVFSPVVYYSILENKSLKQFTISSFKIGFAALVGFIAETIFLLFQHRALSGSLYLGVDHIISSFFRRTVNETTDAISIPLYNHFEILELYLKGNVFNGAYSGLPAIWFIFPIILIFIICYFLIKRNKSRLNNSDRALAITTVASVVCPLSWLIIFKGHANNHPHFDYIIWYIPFLILGFLVVGRSFSLLLKKKDVIIK